MRLFSSVVAYLALPPAGNALLFVHRQHAWTKGKPVRHGDFQRKGSRPDPIFELEAFKPLGLERGEARKTLRSFD